MDAKVLEGIKRATLRVKTILDESEALLKELKSRRPRTPDVTLEQELAPSNQVSDVEVDEFGKDQAVEEELQQEAGEEAQEELQQEAQEELQQEAQEELQESGEGKPQLEDLNQTQDTDSSDNGENETYVSSDEEDVPLYRESAWSCCCRRS